MMKRYALSLVLVLICVGNLFAQNGVLKTYDVRTYGAKGDGTTDDTAAIARAIAAAVAYEAVTDETVMVLFPKGTYIVQDTGTATTGTGEAYGGVVIPSTTESIILMGQDATVKAGSNGITTSIIRCFADNCIIEGFTVDPNGDAAPVSDAIGADGYYTKDNSGIELNGCENSVIRNCLFINGDKTATTYNTGTVSYDHTGGSSERLVTLSGGSFPAWVDTDAAITIAGVRYPIASVLSSTTLTLNAASSTNTVNNPGADVGSTSNWSVSSYMTTSQGEDGMLITNGTRCKIQNCLSLDNAWTSYRVSGDNNSILECTAVNFKGNGIRITTGESVHIRGFKAYSTRCDGRSAIIADAGSSQYNLRTNQVFIEDSELYCNPDGDFDGAASTLKLASCYQAYVKNCKIECGSSTNNVAVRLEDNLRNVFFQDCFIKPVILFTPASGTGAIYQGDLTAHASGTGGRVRFTVSGTPSASLLDGSGNGRELQVRGSGVDQYNGPQAIYARGAGYIETERLYVAGTLGSGTHGQTGVETFKMRNCTVDGIMAANAGVTTVSFYNYFIDSCNAYNVDIEGCTFNQVDFLDVQYGGVLTDYITDNGWSMFRFVRNKITFNTTKTCRVHRGTTAGTEMSTSGKTIWYGNEKHNKSSGTVYWTDETNTERAYLFATAGEQSNVFLNTTTPSGSTVTWAVGDIIWNSAPSAGEPLGWYCTVGGTSETWQQIESRVPLTLASNTTEVGNVGSGEDNLITYTVPANTLSRDGDCLEVEAAFTFAANGNNKTVKLYIGSDVIYNSGAVAQNGGSMIVRASLTRDTGVIAKVTAVTVPSASSSYSTVATYFQTATAFASTNVVKGTGTATSDNDVVQEYQRVRLIPAPPP